MTDRDRGREMGKTPWSTKGECLYDRDGQFLAAISGTSTPVADDIALAERIKMAVNAHEELVAALKLCEHVPICSSWFGEECDCVVPATLAKAEGR
jgi:hypothetical protein